MTHSLSEFFLDDVHQPFVFQGADTAVVLIHGFPGTPAEIRGLAGRLNQHGWTTNGILLPGFGREIDKLFDHKHEHWVGAVTEAVNEIRSNHDRVFLLGYSFGGAVSLLAARQAQIDGLILAAPFWRIGSGRERWIWRLLRPFFPAFKPFRRVDFNNPRITEGLSKMLPGIDLSQPEAQKALREMRVPAQIFEEVMRLGASAKTACGGLEMPVLVLQGSQDEVISPAHTRELHAEIPGAGRYIEVDDGHELLEPASPSFEATLGAIIRFVEENGPAKS